jgi:hypothetical protein
MKEAQAHLDPQQGQHASLASSRQHLHYHHFTAETPADAEMDTTRKHGRRSLCSSCFLNTGLYRFPVRFLPQQAGFHRDADPASDGLLLMTLAPRGQRHSGKGC